MGEQYNGQVNYSNGPYLINSHKDCVNMTTGNYYLKNQSTKTYMQAAGASNAAKLSLAAKKDTSAFQFNLTGSKAAGYYLATKLNTGYVVNPYSDTPANGTAINIYKKDNSGTQLWEFDKSGSGYIVHLKNNSNLCLTADGTSVVLKSKTNAANQIWLLEDEVSLVSVSIATPATYSIYPVGAKIDTSGLTLTLKYSDGSTKNITDGFSTSADLSAIGKTKVTVSYEGKTVTYDVEVKNYFDGDGTEASPYLIKSKSDLNTLAAVVNNVAISNSYKQAYYKQTADIDLENEEFTPIGIFYSSETDSLINEIAFDGIYNGGKHSIINLSVNRDSKYSGLFGRTQRHSVIKELSVYGNVTGNDVCTGGIVGEVGYGGKVLNCSFNGTVTGAQLVGGITSSLQGGGTVSGCYVNAAVKTKSSGGNALAGGIAGRPHVGHASNSENAEISNCYFVGSVPGAVTGGIVGKTVIETTKNNTVTYSNNYFLKSDGLSASGDESIASNNGRALSEELMKNVSEILGTPFALNWSNNLNDGYPVFEWQVILRGDANNDGEVNIADAVMLQKWLLGSGDLTNWQNVDLCEDGVIDVFDMVFMRKIIIEK